MGLIRAKFNTRLVLISSAIVVLVLYLFEHIFYIPNKNKPYAVFLAPRFYGEMNDLKSGVFSQWSGLLLVIVLGAIVIGTGLNIILFRDSKRIKTFIYISAVVMSISFQLLSPQGFDHLIEQSRSVNNGTIYSIGQLLKNPIFATINPLEKIQYLFVDLGANDSGYTIPGTTHPPGWFLIVFMIAGVAKVISFGSDLNTNLFYWGLLVTLINCTIAPLVFSISREIFGKKMGAISSLFLILTPSALMHFCAMADSIGTLFFAISILQVIRIFNLLDGQNDKERHSERKVFFRALSSGSFLVLAAQVAYSLIIPISALVISTILLIGIQNKKVPQILSGFLIPYFFYSVCELLLSSGKSFWILRAFSITKDPIFSDLKILRPFPLAQIANFEIVFVMGGIFLLPSVILALSSTLRITPILPEFESENQMAKFRFLLYVWGFSSMALLIQSTARLEVERVWHWYLLIGWIVSGYFLRSLQLVLGRDENKAESNENYFSYRFIALILALQFAITLVLGMSIQDYY